MVMKNVDQPCRSPAASCLGIAFRAIPPDPLPGQEGGKRKGGTVYEQIDIKRKALGIDKARERVLYDMEMRRDLT